MNKSGGKIKFAVVGCGRISNRHIQSIKKNPNAELYAICDINLKKLEEVKKSNSEIEKIYNNFNDLLRDKNVDVINICTPSYLHPEMVIKAVSNGKTVLCEKPLGLDYKNSLKTVEAAKSKKKNVFICFQNRYNPPISYLKKILGERKLGKILMINATVRWYRDDSYYNDWHGERKLGGGILFNQAIHYIDIILYLMNKKPISVYCESKTLGHKTDVDDMAVANIEFEGNTFGLIEATTLSYPKNMEGSIILQCEKGTVKIGGMALNEIEYWEGEGKPKKKIGSQIENIYGESHYRVIDKVIKVLKGKEKPFSTAKESLLAIKLAEKSYESARKGKKIKL